MTIGKILPDETSDAILIGRLWRPELKGPSLVALRTGVVIDITSSEVPTMSALLEREDAAEYVACTAGEELGAIETLLRDTQEAPDSRMHLLAPCDLQAVKACGVTFARSMIERVIEERAAGDATRADAIRGQISALIGDSLCDLVPGSKKASEVKAFLLKEGLWSQYLEVGIGPDAEVFTKAQPMSAVGWGAAVGLHPISDWNNPEPEIVLAVASSGQVRGATLGNDVNLRDVEGRSALLLGKAKDNNAAASIGPFIRLFDECFGMDDIRNAELTLRVEGEDGYVLNDTSSMSEISRDPEDLVRQTIGRHHQYPDGLMLYLGTLFAPTKDRDEPGIGFTHKVGDRVSISEPRLGCLTNTVRLATECPEWRFGTNALIQNLSQRNLI